MPRKHPRPAAKKLAKRKAKLLAAKPAAPAQINQMNRLTSLMLWGQIQGTVKL